MLNTLFTGHSPLDSRELGGDMHTNNRYQFLLPSLLLCAGMGTTINTQIDALNEQR